MAAIRCIEGVPFDLDPSLIPRLQDAMARLRRELRPRFSIFSIDQDGCRISNVIGSIDLGGSVIDVEPKTRPGDNWIESALSLLVGSDRIDAGGDRNSDLSERRSSLWEALVARYVNRLEVALRREGPLLAFAEQRERDGTVRGRLDVHAWFDGLPSTMTHMPLVVRQLSPDNDFSRTMSLVAKSMARTVRSPILRARLTEAASQLRPGLPDAYGFPPGIEARLLPAQWNVYRPAWNIVLAVLRRRSLLAPSGNMKGLAVSFEAWPLLERLLKRSLASAVANEKSARPTLTSHAQDEVVLLHPKSGPYRAHPVKPDGLLREGGLAIGTFEAKYRDFDPEKGPKREDIYQAVSTALAVGAPTAVLVYPNTLPEGEWRIISHAGGPVRLFAVGLSMFSYRAGDEDSLGRRLLEICS